MSSAKYYKLNQKQLHTLKLLYKFRFITIPLLAHYKHISSISSRKSLEVLRAQGYIERHYDTSYKLRGKAARYYLTSKGLKILLHIDFPVNERVRHAMYKNSSVSESFVDQQVSAMQVYLALRDSNPDTFHIFSKTELAKYSYMPERTPDLYLNRMKYKSNKANEYMLNIYLDIPLFVFKKEFAALLEHFDSGDWEATSQTNYPAILIVCGDTGMEKRIQRHIYKTLDNMGIDDLQIYLTTVQELHDSNGDTKIVWRSVYEPEKLSAI